MRLGVVLVKDEATLYERVLEEKAWMDQYGNILK